MQYQDRHRESSFLILTPPLTIEAASATPITPDPGESGGRGDNCDSILVIIFRTFTSDKLICLNAGCYPKIHINWSSGRFFNSCRILICLSSCILLLQPSLFLGVFLLRRHQRYYELILLLVCSKPRWTFVSSIMASLLPSRLVSFNLH